MIRAIEPADVLALGDPTRAEEQAEAAAINAVIGTALAATPTPTAALRVLVWGVATLCEDTAEPGSVLDAAIQLLREWRGDPETDALLRHAFAAPSIEPPEGWQERVLARIAAGKEQP